MWRCSPAPDDPDRHDLDERSRFTPIAARFGADLCHRLSDEEQIRLARKASAMSSAHPTWRNLGVFIDDYLVWARTPRGNCKAT